MMHHAEPLSERETIPRFTDSSGSRTQNFGIAESKVCRWTWS